MDRRIFATLAATALLASPAFAADEVCSTEKTEIDRDLYLRRLTLDLLGRPPTADEYRAVAGEVDVPEAMIDAMLASDGFVARMQRFVADLIYPATPDYYLGYASILVPHDYESVDPVYWRQYKSEYPYDVVLPAGVTNTYLCVDEPAPDPAFDFRGEPLPLRMETIEGYLQPTYGYVEVEPYWIPGRRLKVCAIDARELAIGNDGYSRCDTVYGSGTIGCGCGENLKWCSTFYDHLTYYGTDYRISDAIRAELDWAVRRVVAEDRSWIELFTTQETFIQGPLAYFYKNQRYLTDVFNMELPPLAEEVLNSIDYSSPGVVVDRGENHAGILTTANFLLRHQTARARVNRFDTAFLCQPYSPPTGGIGDLSTIAPNPNLAEREKCSYCHERLEERAPAFGMLAEVGGTFLDPETHPLFRQDCFECAAESFESGLEYCEYDCSRNYYVARDGDRVTLQGQWGKKKELAFRGDDAVEKLQRGPRSLVEGVEPAIGQCLVSRMTQSLLHRSPEAGEENWINELGEDFAGGGYRVRELVKQIVTSKTYRRAS